MILVKFFLFFVVFSELNRNFERKSFLNGNQSMNNSKPSLICNTINTPAKALHSLTMSRLVSMGNRHRLLLSALAAFTAGFLLLVSCGKKSVAFTPDERKTVDSIVRSVRTPDSLALLQKQLESKGDKLGSVVALREWGKALRNDSRFEEALRTHSEGLRQA